MIEYCPYCGKSLKRLMKKPSPHKIPEEYARAIRLHKDGYSCRQIAKIVKRGHSTIHRWINNKNKWVRDIK